MEVPRPAPPVPDPCECLRYDSAARSARPELLLARFAAASGSVIDSELNGVFVVPRSELDRLRALPTLVFAGDQHVTRTAGKTKTMRLVQTFQPYREDRLVLVNAAYTSAGRAAQGVRPYVNHVPVGTTRIVAVADHIYLKLRSRAAPPELDREIVRAIRAKLGGVSPAVAKLQREIATLGPGRGTVMILGETGTGKEEVAKLLHLISGRKGPIQKIDATSIPESLAEAELFGTVVGGASGAVNRPGPFEVASGGTVFIDEIGELPLPVQAKLLRVLQDREIVRVGSTKPVPVDIRVIIATHRDLAAMVARGQFREDLYQRLLVSVIDMPVVREQREDVAFHIQRAWREYTGESFPKHLAKMLLKLDWPGNVRQIQNFMLGLHEQTRGSSVGRAQVEKQLRKFFPRKPDPDPDPSAPPPRRPAPPGPDGDLRHAIRSYETARGAYRDLEQVARSLVERLVTELSPLAVVRSRTKTATALAGRLQRSWTDDIYRDVRDLCGVRVIVQAEEHKLALLDALERFVEVEPGPYPAGHDPKYDAERAPSLCWIKIRKSRLKDIEGRLGMVVPGACAGQWCELQLRTTTEDAIAAWRETIIGRLDAPPPETWTQSLAEVEDLLARAQGVFERIRRCATSYGGHLSRDDMQHELQILERTLRCAPSDPTIAGRAGKLALNLGQFDRARTIMAPYERSQYGPLLRDLGVAICQTHDPGSAEYARGLDLLERACDASPRDPEAHTALAGAYLRADHPDRALERYREALRIDDSYPYAVSGLLQLEVRRAPNSDVLAVQRPMLKRAVARCHEEIQASVGVPFAHLNLGKFLVLLGKTREGLASYLDAVRTATAPFMFQTSIESLSSLLEARCIPGVLDVARRMLQIGLCARYPCSEVAELCAASLTRIGEDVHGPVVVLVGRGGDPSSAALASLGEVLAVAFTSFRGTVASVGDHDRAAPAIRSVLAALPAGARAVRYGRDRVEAYCSMVPDPQPEDIFYPTLAPWGDVAAAGEAPSSVLVLTLGDEPRTAPDRHLARALGAHVAVLDVARSSAENSTDGTRVIRDANALRAALERLRAH